MQYIKLLEGGRLNLLQGGSLLRLEQDPVAILTTRDFPTSGRRKKRLPRPVKGEGGIVIPAPRILGYGTVGIAPDLEDDLLLLDLL